VIRIDSSTIIAIMTDELSMQVLLERLSDDEPRIMSVANHVETGAVLIGRRRCDPWTAVPALDAFLKVLKTQA
jgi:uncharacterized protein with PIN domain